MELHSYFSWCHISLCQMLSMSVYQPYSWWSKGKNSSLQRNRHGELIRVWVRKISAPTEVEEKKHCRNWKILIFPFFLYPFKHHEQKENAAMTLSRSLHNSYIRMKQCYINAILYKCYPMLSYLIVILNAALPLTLVKWNRRYTSSETNLCQGITLHYFEEVY